MTEANEYLEKELLPNYWNLRNKQAAPNSESHYRKISPRLDLDNILCIKELSWTGKKAYEVGVGYRKAS